MGLFKATWKKICTLTGNSPQPRRDKWKGDSLEIIQSGYSKKPSALQQDQVAICWQKKKITMTTCPKSTHYHSNQINKSAHLISTTSYGL